MFVMILEFCTELYPNLILDFDNTQYVIDKVANDKYVSIKLEENDLLTAKGTGNLVSR